MLLASVERAERQARLATLGTADPQELQELLEAATKVVQNYTSRDLVRTAYTDQFHHGNGTRSIELCQYPLITLTAVKVVDGNETEESFTGSIFRTELESGIIVFKPSETGVFLNGFENLKITYTAGYTEIPDDLQHVTILMAIRLLDMQTFGTDMKRRKLGDYEEERFKGELISDPIRQLLAPYVDYSRRF